MKWKCPRNSCKNDPKITLVVCKGYYYRKSDSRLIQRFFCKKCKRGFSRASFSTCFGQNKRRVNEPLRKLLCSGVSLRRSAILLNVHRKTVVRKFIFLGINAVKRNKEFTLNQKNVLSVQFDDLETSEHSKCKPVSVSLVVKHPEREILGFRVSQMPSKGLLAKISREKYGYRADKRPQGWLSLLKELRPIIDEKAEFLSDKNPLYPSVLKKVFPNSTHTCVKGQRGCVAGQGELKKITYDPLFSLNHTCAMLRANINRLFRRTWCTTKKMEFLVYHIALYVQFHNENLKSI